MLLYTSSQETITFVKELSARFRILGSFAFLIAILGIAATPRSCTATLLACYGSAFILYLVFLTQQRHWQWWLFTGIAARFLLIFIFPQLSDDIYRFFWDGTLTISGVNPYEELPSFRMNEPGVLPSGLRSIFPLLNSPQYYTVYPLVCQVFFAVSAFTSGADVAVFAIVLKSIFFLCECGTMYYLYLLLRERDKQPDILLYALNPLVLIELIGNLHCEAIMILLLLVFYRLLQKRQILASAVAISLAIATKLIPVLFVPFLLRRMKSMQFVVFAGVAALCTTMLFIPALTVSNSSGYLSSVELYFRQFEFNASFYYLGRWLGFMKQGYNTIATTGPLLALVSLSLMTLYLILERRPELHNFPVAAITSLTIYFFFATTVHPWYLSTLVAFCTLTTFRYPIVWSGLVFFTYTAYRTEPPDEVLWLVGLEYVLVLGWCAMEWMRKTRSQASLSGI